MNPLMNVLTRKIINKPKEKQSVQQQISQITKGFKDGTINPKTTAMDMLKNMNAEQKKALKQLVPQIKTLGKTLGVSETNLNLFITELNKQL